MMGHTQKNISAYYLLNDKINHLTSFDKFMPGESLDETNQFSCESDHRLVLLIWLIYFLYVVYFIIFS